MIHSNNWKKGILSIDCTIRKNITDIISKIEDYPCTPKSWHLDLDYWFSNCNFSPKQFKITLDTIYHHLVDKCKDMIGERVKLKPFTAYLDFSNDGEKIEAAQIKDAAKFLCNVMNNFNHTVGNLFSIIINLSDNATYKHEAITLIEDSPAIIVHEIHEGHGDFHGLYTNN